MEQLFKNMNDRIGPDPRLKAAVMEKAVLRRGLRFRPLAAAAAMLAVLLMATPVMAAYVEPVNDFVYQLSPEMAGWFTPVQESSVENGIKMEILSASIQGDTAEFVVSLEDLTGEWFADGSFLPGFLIRNYGPQHTIVSAMCVEHIRDDYSTDAPENTTRIYRLTHRYENVEAEELLNDKITLIMDSVLKDKTSEIFVFPLELTLREIMTVKTGENYPADIPADMPVTGFQYGSTGDYAEWNRTEEFSMLAPGQTVFNVTEGVAITGIAFVDDKLHIQSRTNSGILCCDAYLVDANGEQTRAAVWYCFQSDTDNVTDFYKEEVFDISEGELENYTLKLVVSGYEMTEGPWKVTFEFEETSAVVE